MSEGKIAYWEALGFKSFREGDFSQAHTYWQNAEHLKRKEHGVMETEQRAHTTRKEKSTRRGFHRIRGSKEPIGD